MLEFYKAICFLNVALSILAILFLPTDVQLKYSPGAEILLGFTLLAGSGIAVFEAYIERKFAGSDSEASKEAEDAAHS